MRSNLPCPPPSLPHKRSQELTLDIPSFPLWWGPAAVTVTVSRVPGSHWAAWSRGCRCVGEHGPWALGSLAPLPPVGGPAGPAAPTSCPLLPGPGSALDLMVHCSHSYVSSR